MNKCKNIHLKGGQTTTCTINPFDRPATLKVYVDVINDDDGNRWANNFKYKLEGNNKPPSKTFKGESGGKIHLLKPGTVSVDKKDATAITPSLSSIDFPPDSKLQSIREKM